ncbi:DUF5076 domain-containing protein [Henriciella aquimarina]|uniref:DUF5076 domain-containing protein n=1 Tax=Henriciella aquimarina TaxID=545261 RepID=UPI001301A5F7|nr:DUF5076 domain-containing protein [Henriciella aquimarina]
MSDQHKALSKPGSIPEDAQAQEYVRFWIANNADHASVLVGAAGDAKKEPAMWGFILADIAKQVTKVMREQDPDGPEAQAILEQIMGGMIERLKHAPHLAGTTAKVDD